MQYHRTATSSAKQSGGWRKRRERSSGQSRTTPRSLTITEAKSWCARVACQPQNHPLIRLPLHCAVPDAQLQAAIDEQRHFASADDRGDRETEADGWRGRHRGPDGELGNVCQQDGLLSGASPHVSPYSRLVSDKGQNLGRKTECSLCHSSVPSAQCPRCFAALSQQGTEPSACNTLPTRYRAERMQTCCGH